MPGRYCRASRFCASVHDKESKTSNSFSSPASRPDVFSAVRIFSVTASISFHVGATSSADLFSANAFKYDFATESWRSWWPSARTTAPIRSNCAKASTVRFCAASSTALRYAALRCRRMAVNWPDLKWECRSKIRSASPRATEACCPVSPDKMILHSSVP